MSIGILGGGISGVTLQHFLKEHSEILEASDSLGGLCRSYHKKGFTYDIGGHILFSKHEHINSLVDRLLDDNINHCKRANKILYNERYIKYPFENDLGSLKKQDNYECLIGYLTKDYPYPKDNLKQWAYFTFGKGISEKYFLPYNEKIWNISTDQISLEWVDRIPQPPMKDIVKSALGIETEGYLHQLYFRYPKKGGAEALVRALLNEESNFQCNWRIQSIEKQNNEWKLINHKGETKYFEDITVAFPIHEAIHCFKNLPKDIVNTVERLRYNSIRVVMIAVNNPSLMDKSAVYLPDPKVLAHRVCFMGYFSPYNVVPGQSSLIAEVTTNPGDGVHEMSDDALIERVIEDLDKLKIINKHDVCEADVRNEKYGYPVYNLNYYEDTDKLHSFFKTIDVPLLGRFAEFIYINSDECMRRAIVLANQINNRVKSIK